MRAVTALSPFNGCHKPFDTFVEAFEGTIERIGGPAACGVRHRPVQLSELTTGQFFVGSVADRDNEVVGAQYVPDVGCTGMAQFETVPPGGRDCLAVYV